MKFSEKRLSLFVNEQVFKTTKDGAGRNGKTPVEKPLVEKQTFSRTTG